MGTTALTGNDTLVLNNHVFRDFADGTVAELTYPNAISSVKTGKNGNSIYGLNESGKQADLKIRLIRGGADDKFLNNLLSQQQANFSGFVLMQGSFVKKIGDGLGNVTSDTFIVSGGVFSKQPEVKSNVEGESDQSVTIYEIKFSNAPRVLT